MKILRSVNRRGFNVGSAGWFTILRPNTWFPASRLPRTVQRIGIQTGEAAEKPESALNGASDQVRSVRWPMIERSEQNQHPVRSASIILGALAITSAMLWWIMHP